MGSGGQGNAPDAGTTTPLNNQPQQSSSSSSTIPKNLRWSVGLLQASTFSLVYLVAPSYILSAVLALCWYRIINAPTWLLCYVAPIIISMVLPPMASPTILMWLTPMLDYFAAYHKIQEVSSEELMVNEGKNYILAVQPHGVISFAGIVSAIATEEKFRGRIPTAVADAVLYTPLLKHVMGIFGLISASKASLLKTLKRPGIEGTIVLYVGGMAELFLSDETEECLYLNKRKGFIKLSMQSGVDIIPVYLFGNTSVLSVMKHGLLSTLSRKLQVSLTYFWGKWGLPIPRDVTLMYVSGRPLGIPQISNPTQEDIDKHHKLYCQEVQRLFEKYKEKVPEYKHKKLYIR